MAQTSSVKNILLCSYMSKEKFINLYADIQGKQEAKEFYLLLLSEIEKAVLEDNLSSLNKVQEIIKFINNSETLDDLQKCYESEVNPIKNTNLVILSCKHCSINSLKNILENTSLLDNLSTDIGRDSLTPFDEDEMCHNAFYYAIRSGNIEILELLIRKWPGSYFNIHLEKLDEILSSAYDELKLRNVLLSQEIEISIQNKLLSLRFFSDTSEKGHCGYDLNDIKNRVQIVIDKIMLLVDEYRAKTKDVNEIFLYLTKLITLNINVLKRQLKSTYNKLPWEEMEFLLCIFILSHTKQQRINIFNHVVLGKDRIVNHLEHFGKKLSEIAIFEHLDISKLAQLPRLKRDNVVKQLRNADFQFEDLYNDYTQVRDIHSLDRIINSINLALSVDPVVKENRLIITRVLQVTGEYLKNTLESPKLSTVTSELILLSLPQNTQKIITDLRNSLSHEFALSKRIEIEENMDTNFFVGILSDMKKIRDVISNILLGKKIKIIRTFIENIINSENFYEIKNAVVIASQIDLKNFEENLESREDETLEKLIEKFSSAVSNKTFYEKLLFHKINTIIKSKNTQLKNNFKCYMLGFIHLISYCQKFIDCKFDQNDIRALKLRLNATLGKINSETEPDSIKEIASLSMKIWDSVTMRMQRDMAEVLRLFLKIFSFAEFETRNIKWIEELRETLSEKDFVSARKQKHKTCPLTEETCSKLLALKISELKSILNENNLIDTDESIYLFMNNKKKFAILETLILDIMSILGASKEYHLENNFLFLDENAPSLTGKCLRNHLAHYNTVVELLSDPKIAIILNAKKLCSEDIEHGQKSFGKLMGEISLELKCKHDKGLEVMTNQKNMFTALEEGDIESFKVCLKKGADINARSIDLWTTLHLASKGPSLDIIKFICKNSKPNARNLNGRNPLHIAAVYGRQDIVEFFVREVGMHVDDIDNIGKTPLHLAALHGHKDTVIILLENNAKITFQDGFGFSPLHYAIINGHTDVAKFLLKRYVSVDIVTEKGGFTALHDAAENGNVDLVYFLLQNGANVNAKTVANHTPLHGASINGFIDVVNILLLKGANVNARLIHGSTALHNAAESGHEKIADVLLKHGADVNAFERLFHNQPLHYASGFGHEDLVKILLKYKADVNAATVNGMTPLLCASEAGHLEIVNTLLNYNIDVNAKNKDYFTGLHFAIEKGYLKIVDLLIKNGALVHIKDISGFTPLHRAALKNHKEIAELLINNNAELDSKTNMGFTPLHVAVMANSTEIVDLLIKNETEVNVRDKNGCTPLHLAATRGYSDAIDLLLKNKAEVNSKNNKNMTPLHEAACSGHEDVINILIENKAEVNVKSVAGNTPLHIAVEAGHKGIVEILIANGAFINTRNDDGISPLFSAVKINNRTIIEVFISNGKNNTFEWDAALPFAVIAGYKDIMEMMLKYNSDINFKYDGDITLLHLAAERGHEIIVKSLILKGADVNAVTSLNETPLLIAAAGGHEVVSKILLNNGANSDVRDVKNRSGVELAVANGHLHVVKLLLNYKVDINVKSDDDWTLLHTAAQKNNLEIIRYLVNKNCDMHAKSTSGLKPVHVAAREGFKDIVEFFLNKGCNVNDFIFNKQSLLHQGAMSGQLEIVQYLISKGADVNSKDDDGLTPIHIAAKCGNKDAVKHLLNCGAYLNSVDNFNRKSLDFTKDKDVFSLLESTENLFKAVKHCNISETERCIKSGAVVNAKNAESATPLHFAACKGYIEIVEVLLKHKSNPNAVCRKGFTPLHYACKFSHLNIVKSLLCNGAIYEAASHSGKTPFDLAVDKSIIAFLQYVSNVFGKVKNNNFRVVNNLSKKDSETVKAVLNARNRDNQTIVVFAILSSFSKVEQLKAILQGDVLSEIHRALISFNNCRYPEALTSFHSILEKRKGILGPDNPGTLDIQVYIARVLYKQGAYAEASKMLEEILAKQKEMLGLNNKYTLRTLSFTALILHRLGKDEEALGIYREVYPKQLDLLSSDDDDILETQLHIALVLNQLKKYDEALFHNQDVYKKFKKSQSPLAINAQNNIAMVLASQGKIDEALKVYREVLETKKKVLGINHADTLRTSHSTAVILMTQKKYSEALKTFKEILSIQTNVLGTCHPETLKTRWSIGDVLFEQHEWFGAFRTYKELLEPMTNIFGTNDSFVLDIKAKIEMIKLRFETEGRNESDILQCLQKNIITASNDGDIQAVKHLLNTGADVNEKDIEGRTPLHFAASNGHADVVKILLENGGDCTLITNKGNTPLHTAASKGDEEISKLLLQHTSNVKLNDLLNSATTVGKNTSLHVAAKNGFFGIVISLLSHGAIYNIKNKDGKLPFDLSTDLHVSNVLRLLGELFEDAKKGNALIINKLKTAKPEKLLAITNARNHQGKTLLQVAICNKHQTVANELLKVLRTR